VKVHLIDGTYELFRAFYASRAGARVSPLRVFLQTLLALLREQQVTHAAVAFDHVVESFRNRLYAGYKTGASLDPRLRALFEPAEEASRALGLLTWPMVELEADDALATGAAQFADASGVERVVICSPDKDLAQCVRGTRIVCLDRLRRRTLDESGVLAKYGVRPASIPDWLALLGDSADGYPGLAGWGAKSAASILSVYTHLEAIPDDPSRWTAKIRGARSLAETLRERREEAYLFRDLATLRTDAPLNRSLDTLRWHGPEEAALGALAERLGERRILARATELAGRLAN
jgi:5'-3' exonuclease